MVSPFPRRATRSVALARLDLRARSGRPRVDGSARVRKPARESGHEPDAVVCPGEHHDAVRVVERSQLVLPDAGRRLRVGRAGLGHCRHRRWSQATRLRSSTRRPTRTAWPCRPASLAISPTVCVAMGENTIRLFVKNPGVAASDLHIQAYVQNPLTGLVLSTGVRHQGQPEREGLGADAPLLIPNLLGGLLGTQNLTLVFSDDRAHRRRGTSMTSTSTPSRCGSAARRRSRRAAERAARRGVFAAVAEARAVDDARNRGAESAQTHRRPHSDTWLATLYLLGVGAWLVASPPTSVRLCGARRVCRSPTRSHRRSTSRSAPARSSRPLRCSSRACFWFRRSSLPVVAIGGVLASSANRARCATALVATGSR